jgi:hypothetical protein
VDASYPKVRVTRNWVRCPIVKVMGSSSRVFHLAQTKGGVRIMQPTAIWIIYTLMFGYPVPLGEHEFTSEAACVIHMRLFGQQVIDAFQLVCARRSVEGS